MSDDKGTNPSDKNLEKSAEGEGRSKGLSREQVIEAKKYESQLKAQGKITENPTIALFKEVFRIAIRPVELKDSSNVGKGDAGLLNSQKEHNEECPELNSFFATMENLATQQEFVNKVDILENLIKDPLKTLESLDVLEFTDSFMKTYEKIVMNRKVSKWEKSLDLPESTDKQAKESDITHLEPSSEEYWRKQGLRSDSVEEFVAIAKAYEAKAEYKALKSYKHVFWSAFLALKRSNDVLVDYQDQKTLKEVFEAAREEAEKFGPQIERAAQKEAEKFGSRAHGDNALLISYIQTRKSSGPVDALKYAEQDEKIKRSIEVVRQIRSEYTRPFKNDSMRKIVELDADAWNTSEKADEAKNKSIKYVRGYVEKIVEKAKESRERGVKEQERQIKESERAID